MGFIVFQEIVQKKQTKTHLKFKGNIWIIQKTFGHIFPELEKQRMKCVEGLCFITSGDKKTKTPQCFRKRTTEQ